MAYVVILNHAGPISLRHIVDTQAPYNEEEFARWYYAEYQRLDGDEFVFCPTRDAMLECVAASKAADDKKTVDKRDGKQ